MARQEGQGQAPGSPRMYRVGERKRGQREKSKKSGREDNADTSEKHVKDKQPTLSHAAVAQRLHQAIR